MTDFLNDLHQFDIRLTTWTKVDYQLETAPSPRESVGMAWVEGQLYLFGGQNSTGDLKRISFRKCRVFVDDIAPKPAELSK